MFKHICSGACALLNTLPFYQTQTMNINFVLVMTWRYLNTNKADAIFIIMNHFRHDRFDETNLRFWSLISDRECRIFQAGIVWIAEEKSFRFRIEMYLKQLKRQLWFKPVIYKTVFVGYQGLLKNYLWTGWSLPQTPST